MVDGARQPIPIVILNWNGEDDTIECLRSIKASKPAGFVPVVVDNGSEAASVERLKQECRLMYGNVQCLSGSEVRASEGLQRSFAAGVSTETLVFIQNGENLGFAKGSNVGVRFADIVGADWVLLLNNDTTVAPDAFRELRSFLQSESSFVAVTPQIRYFDPATRIQNCGGRLTYLGSRRYRFENKDVSVLPPSPFSVISFATGCALLFNHRITGPLTEDFFFGEEDYEFSLRLRKRGLRMACNHRAIVWHKGGATINSASSRPGQILVQYASRLANVRNYYSVPRWRLTRFAAYAYLPLLLFRSGLDPRSSIGMIRKIEAHLKRHRGVERAEYQAMIMTT
jgi:GT2 family glycosyltransferase